MNPIEEQAILLCMDACRAVNDNAKFYKKYHIGKAYCDKFELDILPVYDKATARWINESRV